MTRDLIVAVRNVGIVLTEENEALARSDYEAAIAKLPMKEAALAALGKVLTGSEVHGSEPAIGGVVARLRQQALENQEMLRSAVEAQHRLVSMIVRVAAEASSNNVYNGRGFMEGRNLPGASAMSVRV
jgi:hypothetical protein